MICVYKNVSDRLVYQTGKVSCWNLTNDLFVSDRLVYQIISIMLKFK